MLQDVTVTKVEDKKAGRTDRVVLHYSSAKTNGATWEIGALIVKLDSSSREILQKLRDKAPVKKDTGVSKLYEGLNDLATIETNKVDGYWNLITISSAQQSGATQATNIAQNTTVAKTKTYDDTGVKVGASRNQALAFLAATQGKNFTLDDVDTVAYEIVKRQAAQEENVRNGTTPQKKTELREDEEITLEQQYAQAHSDDLGF